MRLLCITGSRFIPSKELKQFSDTPKYGFCSWSPITIMGSSMCQSWLWYQSADKPIIRYRSGSSLNAKNQWIVYELNSHVQLLTTQCQLVLFRPTVHESVGEDHDRVVEVSVLLSDHAECRSLLLLRRIPGRDAGRQIDDDHVGGWLAGDKKISDWYECKSALWNAELSRFDFRKPLSYWCSVWRGCWCCGAAGRPSGSPPRAAWLHRRP